MNVFFIIDNILITPPSDEGTILAGITRDSVIILAKEMGIKVDERKISVEEFIQAHKENRVQDVFGAGTAATIAPINIIGYRGVKYQIPALETRSVSAAIKTRLNQIKYGEVADNKHWMMKVKVEQNIVA